MKNRNLKKVLSLVSAVLIVCSLSVCAMADMCTVKVTVKSGDTLNGICQQHGVDYYKNKELIMRLNNISDPKQLDRIKVGSVIEIPASASDAAAMNTAANIQVVTKNGTAVTRSGPVTIVAGDASGMGAGDSISYYIVLYTIRQGDTLISLYNSWGMNFASYQSQIMSLNGMSNLDNLVVGKMLYLPVNRADIAGVANYAVVAHSISSGETVYGICQRFGLDFNKASASLQSFNPSVSFSSVRVGQVLNIPVTVSSVYSGNAVSSYNYSASGYTNTAAYTNTTANAQTGGTVISSAGVVTNTAAYTPGNIPAVTTYDNPAMPNIDVVYDGYAVVLSNNGYLSLRLETYDLDVNVAYTLQTISNYSPRPGDYVRVIFTPTDFQLVYVQYVYNVFTGR